MQDGRTKRPGGWWRRRFAAGLAGDRPYAAAATSRVKRAIDVTVAAGGLVVLAPVMAAVYVAVALGLGRPALYRQERPGLHGQFFTLVKFRTMNERRDPSGALLPDEERLTTLGRWLRRTSLDELPELVNVLRGEMSLVGPRPLVKAYLSRYSPAQARRHDVKPGMTGLAQINGRNATPWPQRLALDVEYVDGWSIGFDLRILVATAAKLVRRDDDAAAGDRLSSHFFGDGDDRAGDGPHWDPEKDVA